MMGHTLWDITDPDTGIDVSTFERAIIVEAAAELDKLREINAELLEALIAAEYAIRHASGDTIHSKFSRPFDYKDFQVWAEQWLNFEARPAIAKATGEAS